MSVNSLLKYDSADSILQLDISLDRRDHILSALGGDDDDFPLSNLYAWLELNKDWIVTISRTSLLYCADIDTTVTAESGIYGIKLMIGSHLWTILYYHEHAYAPQVIDFFRNAHEQK